MGRYLRQVPASGGTRRGEFHNRRKDGTLFWEAAWVSLIVDEAGRATHRLAIKEDVTSFKQRELELQGLVAVSAALRGALHSDRPYRRA